MATRALRTTCAITAIGLLTLCACSHTSRTIGISPSRAGVTQGGLAADTSELSAAGLTFTGYSKTLPEVGYTGCISQGDQWLQEHLGGYAQWTYTHDSLLIATWDENDGAKANHIPTVFVGAGLLSGTDSTPSTHYTILRTIEGAYHLPLLGGSAAAQPLTADRR